MYPDDLRYHKDHMWLRAKGNRAKIGITYYAQEQLGDIVFIELPETGIETNANAIIGEIESTKTTSTIEAPVSGKIVEINDALEETPEVINEDPYGKGWIAVIDMTDPEEVNDLMDSKGYQNYIEAEAR
jgi:glycine cleavage system H protein